MARFIPIELPYQRRNRAAAQVIGAMRWNVSTPDDAKEGWCFAGRKLYADEDGSGAGINRRADHKAEQISPCIAERCLAWRWSQIGARDVYGEGYFYPTKGYCGLAGNP